MVNKFIKKNPKNASAIIIYYKKKILLNLRSNKKNIFYPNHWGLIGGAKEKNESFRSAAIREFLEETSVETNSSNLLFFNRINFSFPNKPKKLIIRNYYTKQVKNIIKFKKNFFLTEGIKSNFFTYNEIIKLKRVVPYDKLAIDLFFSYIK